MFWYSANAPEMLGSSSLHRKQCYRVKTISQGIAANSSDYFSSSLFNREFSLLHLPV